FFRVSTFSTLNPHLVSSVSQHALGGVVEVNEGAESVLLPCIYSGTPPEDPLLIWTRSDLSPTFVHLRREKGDDLKNQNQRFRNRTSMNPDALDTGNFSLTLRKPEQDDGGNYSCSISDGREERNLKQIHLKVKVQPQRVHRTPQEMIGYDPCTLVLYGYYSFNPT
uniref:Ig-like domain-containing protein n=1 Tax=Poecilia mexicana TaxID=48701 RepID=A0A3B3YIM8_9TELE